MGMPSGYGFRAPSVMGDMNLYFSCENDLVGYCDVRVSIPGVSVL